MTRRIHLPIFFKKLDKIKEGEGKRISYDILEDREKLLQIWGRIMHYSTNIENILKEHLNYENRNFGLGKLIDEFERDCRSKRRFIRYSKLISALKKLNKKCRIIWSHGCLTYSLKRDILIKHLIYSEENRRGVWIRRRREVGNDYFDQIANKLYPEVISGLFSMWDTRDSNGNPHLKIKTPFIIPIQEDSGIINFIFVKVGD